MIYVASNGFESLTPNSHNFRALPKNMAPFKTNSHNFRVTESGKQPVFKNSHFKRLD
jgi:hypothetical protein